MADNNIQDLNLCLTQIGFNTDRLRAAITAEGFASIEDLGDVSVKDVEDMCKKISGLSNNRGGVRIGLVLVRRLKGRVYWVKDHQRRGQIANAEDWSLDICRNSIEAMDIEQSRKDDDSKIDAPGKLKAHEWLQWELRLVNFLQSLDGASRVPLNYIIRKDVPDDYVFANDMEELVYSSPLEGAIFDADNHKVFGIIKQSTADTTNWDWIKTLNRSQDGRMAMQTLRAHYDGPGEVEKRIALANQSLGGLHYLKESTFPFSSYVTGLNACYKTLEEAGEPYSERNKVSTMLAGIRNQNQYVIAAVQNVRTNPLTKSNFTAAANELSEQIAIIFPGESRMAHPVGGRGRGRDTRRMSSMDSRGRGRGRGNGGRFQGRGRGGGYRGGHGGGRGNYQGGRGRGTNRDNNRTMLDGIDVSDVTRSFTDTEWGQLSSDTRRHVHEERERKRQRTDNSGNNDQRGIGATNTTNDTGREPPQNNTRTEGAGRAVGFGRDAYTNGGRGGGILRGGRQ